MSARRRRPGPGPDRPAPAAPSPPAAPAATPLRRADLAWVAGVAAVLFAPSLGHLPTLDDGWVVFDNPLVRTADVVRIFTEPYNAGGPSTTGGLFRPVTTLTYALNHLAGGYAGWGYHLVNVLLHALASVLVLGLAHRVAREVAPARAREAALAAALLFALHPVHVEAVAALTGRAELLATSATVGAILLAARGGVALAGAAALSVVGVLSKEIAATAPGLFGLLAILVPGAAGLAARPGLRGPAARAALLRAAAGVAALAAGVAVYFLVRPGSSLGVPLESQWFGGRPRTVVLGTMARAAVEYLRLLVFPHPLGTDFLYAARVPQTPLGAPAALAAAGALAALGGFAALRARRAPLLALAVGWVAVALLPVSNVLLPTGVLMAERLLYLPSVGFCLWAGLRGAEALAWARGRSAAAGRLAAVAAAVVALALAARAVTRTLEWRNPRALFEAELRGAPLDPVVNNNLAVEYTGAGEYARARERLEVALRVAPGYWRAHVNLGIVKHRQGDLSGALASFTAAAAIAPRAASPWFFRGVALAEAGELAPAEAAFRSAAAREPQDPRTRQRLADVLRRQGRIAEARAELAHAARLAPRDAEIARALAALPPEG